MPNDYQHSNLVYDPTFKQDPLPHCSPNEKLDLDPNYYPPNYVPNEKEDAPLLIGNLISPPENTPKEETVEKNDRGGRR